MRTRIDFNPKMDKLSSVLLEKYSPETKSEYMDQRETKRDTVVSVFGRFGVQKLLVE